MSPHALIVDSNREMLRAELKKFAITSNAFLPEQAPARCLSDPYYAPWELVGQNITSLFKERGVRCAVSEMPLLSTDRLVSEAEWRRAYSLLAYVMHAYIWGGDRPEEVVPPQITVPFLAVSAHVELPPVLAYAGCNLWNFTSSSTDFTDLESLSSLFSFTGTESEAWFLLISVAMEAKGAEIIETMLKAIDSIKIRDYEVIIGALEALRVCIQDVGILLERMYERCDPMTFYSQIRPNYAGSKNMAAAGLPRGVFYDEGNGKGEWHEFRGGSNGQSSLIQFFDLVLGVDHKGEGNSSPSADDEGNFHAEVRSYMPGPHRRFLVHVARMGSIRELALSSAATDEQRRLREAYTAATDALAEFRTKHIQIATRYVVLPSRKTWTGGAGQNLASSSVTKETEELKGTGGTSLIPFLRQARDETAGAGKLGA